MNEYALFPDDIWIVPLVPGLAEMYEERERFPLCFVGLGPGSQ